jgi:hypothetical protein
MSKTGFRVFLLVFAVLLCGCDPSSAGAKVLVRLTAARTDADTCQVSADVRNLTKYHLNEATITVHFPSFMVSDVDAGGQASVPEAYSFVVHPEVPAGKGLRTCAEIIADIYKGATTTQFSVGRCNMQGVPEGDCQKMIEVVPAFDDASIKRSDATIIASMKSTK